MAVKIPVPPRLSTGRVPLVFGAATSRNAMFKGHINTGLAHWAIASLLTLATCIGVVMKYDANSVYLAAMYAETRNMGNIGLKRELVVVEVLAPSVTGQQIHGNWNLLKKKLIETATSSKLPIIFSLKRKQGATNQILR